MNLEIINLIGYIAAVFGTLILLPQVIKSVKTKSVRDVSLLMLIIYLINCILWVVYGSLITSLPVIIGNSTALSFVVIQLFLKIKYEH